MKKKKLNKKKAFFAGTVLLVTVCLIIGLVSSFISSLNGGNDGDVTIKDKILAQTSNENEENKDKTLSKKTEKKTEDEFEAPKRDENAITISFAGDCTFGNFARQNFNKSFDQVYKSNKNDPTYFLKNVAPIFRNDDLTVVNLEGTLTTATKNRHKKYAFKGTPEYTKVMTSSSVEVCSMANNHSQDYYDVGFNDTQEALDDAKIGYFGYETSYVKRVKGFKVGFLGYNSMSPMTKESDKKMVKAAIKKLKKDEECDLVFVYYHWGVEYKYKANDAQREVAHYTIDYGADGVVGSHPHVIQGQETYKGKPIMYSLGNFCFGGNFNPDDKDSMIYQLKYKIKNNKLSKVQVNIIPCYISSTQIKNNYQPTPCKKADAQRILEKIKKYSFEEKEDAE